MKFTKRMATLLMALAMMLCLTVPAFAADAGAATTQQARLTVSGTQLKGKTVHATKMFTASWVDSDGNGEINAGDKLSYTLDKEWEGLFWAQNISTGNCPEGSVNVSNNEGTTLNEKAYDYVSKLIVEANLVDFAAKAAKFKDTNSIENTAAATASSTADENGKFTATFEELVPGYYLVQPEKGSTSATRKTDAMLVNVPSDKAAKLNLKSEYPSVEKKIDTDKTESNAQIGQSVNFTLTSKVPDMSEFDTYYFAFKDTMSKGLTFNENSVKVTVDGQELTKGTGFTVASTKENVADNATEITIVILDMKQNYAEKAGKEITVTYSATLNKDAVVGYQNGNKNEAKVEYQNGPNQNDHGTSNPSITTTRTYPVKVQKHAFDSTVDTSVLAGAKFALSTSNQTPVFNKVGDGYTLDNSDANKAANDAVIPLVGSEATYRVAENDEAGAVTYFTTVGTSATTINGLKAGTYYLHEIEAPEGYNKLTAPVKVTITETTGEDGKVNGVNYTVNDGTASADSNVKIDNKTGSMLPSTGGMGTIGLTVLGVGVVALGVLAPKKKKEKQ